MIAPPKLLKPKFENIPAVLKELPQYVCWRGAWQEDKQKHSKQPINSKSGQLASSTDPATWSTFDQAVERYRTHPGRVDGIGFVLTEGDPIVGVDVDHCVDDGQISQEVAEIISDLNTYAEISPSGTGIRIFAKGKLPPEGRKRGNFEAYDDARFLTVTGHRVPGAPETVNECQEAIDAFHAKYIAKPKKEQSALRPATPGAVPLDAQAILDKAFRAKNGGKIRSLYEGSTADHGGDHSVADMALCSSLAFWTGNNRALLDSIFRSSGLYRDKWDERHYSGGETYGEHTISEAITNCTKFYDWEPKVRSKTKGKQSSAPSSTEDDYQRPLSTLERIDQKYGDRLRLNVHKNVIELEGLPVEVETFYLRLLEEGICNIGRSGEPVAIGKHITADAVAYLAAKNAYDPVKDYLEECHKMYADSTESLLTGAAAHHLGANDPLHDTYLTKFMIGAVARAVKPGCKQQEVLILMGKQGFQKSSFFETLAGPGFYSGSTKAFDGKDDLLTLHSNWIHELAELNAVSNSRSIESVKQFISNSCDTFRPPYGMSAKQHPRRFIMVATTNREDFLGDATGNRRFMPIPVTKRIDLEEIAQIRDQLWAAAVSLYKKGAQWWLTDEERQRQDQDNDEYMAEDPWLAPTRKYLAGRENTTTADVLREALGVETARQTKRDANRLSDIFKTLNWKSTRLGKHRIRSWVPANHVTNPDQPRPTSSSGVGLSGNGSTSRCDQRDQRDQDFSQNSTTQNGANTANSNGNNGHKTPECAENLSKEVGHVGHVGHNGSTSGSQVDQRGRPTVDQPPHNLKVDDFVRWKGQNASDLHTARVWKVEDGIAHVLWSNDVNNFYPVSELEKLKEAP
jgi:predicted P-loop ATPase